MPQGLQIWDATGRLILNLGSRPLKILTDVIIVAGTPQTIPISGATGNVIGVPVLPETLQAPQITVSPTEVNVTWSGEFGSGTGRLFVMEY